jgi:hypothetical protein
MSHETHKAEHADRTVGGPGSSHQNADKPETHTHHEGDREHEHHAVPGAPTSDSRSHRAGGGGEQDRHHSHDPARNSTSRKA